MCHGNMLPPCKNEPQSYTPHKKAYICIYSPFFFRQWIQKFRILRVTFKVKYMKQKPTLKKKNCDVLPSTHASLGNFVRPYKRSCTYTAKVFGTICCCMPRVSHIKQSTNLKNNSVTALNSATVYNRCLVQSAKHAEVIACTHCETILIQNGKKFLKHWKERLQLRVQCWPNIIKKGNEKGESSTIRNFTSQNCSEGLWKFRPYHIIQHAQTSRSTREKKSSVHGREVIQNGYMSQSLHMSRSQFMGANNWWMSKSSSANDQATQSTVNTTADSAMHG